MVSYSQHIHSEEVKHSLPPPHTGDEQHHTPQLPPQVFLLDIVRIFHLSPAVGLPRHLEAGGPRSLFNTKHGGIFSLPLGRVGPQAAGGRMLAPLDDQPRGRQQTLARQHGPLQTGQLPGVERGDPGLHGVAHADVLAARQDGPFVQDGREADAGPDVGGQVGDDVCGGAFLDVAEGFAGVVAGVGFGGGRRPAEEGVGVEVAHDGGDDLGADRALGGVVLGDVDGAADEGGERDEVLLGGLVGGGELVPLQGDGGGEVGFRRGDADDFLCCWVAEGAAVEEDLEGAWKPRSGMLVDGTFHSCFFFFLFFFFRRNMEIREGMDRAETHHQPP